MHFKLACVASVSNRVPSFPSPSPVIHFFCSCLSFLDEPREETLATQANFKYVKMLAIVVHENMKHGDNTPE